MIDIHTARAYKGRVRFIMQKQKYSSLAMYHNAFGVSFKNPDELTVEDLYSEDLIGVYNNSTDPSTIMQDYNDYVSAT